MNKFFFIIMISANTIFYIQGMVTRSQTAKQGSKRYTNQTVVVPAVPWAKPGECIEWNGNLYKIVPVAKGQ